jgi:aspartyl-tRNA(Asn)/glutamyl-tRNA(Gln) amidotransferase subunit A
MIYNAADTLEKQGCKCEEVSLPSVQYALASYYTIATAEASSNLARYDNIRYGFDMNPVCALFRILWQVLSEGAPSALTSKA